MTHSADCCLNCLQASVIVRKLGLLVKEWHANPNQCPAAAGKVSLKGPGETLQVIFLEACNRNYAVRQCDTGALWLLPEWSADISSFKAIQARIAEMNDNREPFFDVITGFSAWLMCFTRPISVSRLP